MLKFASKNVFAPTKFRFPLPENLVDLERRFDAAKSIEEKTAVAQAFTQTVAALRIGHICKTTRWRRLDNSLAMLGDLVTPSQPQSLLDIGVSDGITTLEAVRYLREVRHCTISAIGIDLHSELSRFGGSCVSEYRSNSGDPILARLGPFLLTVGPGASPRQPISRFIASQYLKLRRMRRQLRERKRIGLVNPLARACPDIAFDVQNIFDARQEWTGHFTIVRAANVLNRDYFSEAEIARAIRILFDYLQVGGRLLISRNLAPRENPECAEQGTFWTKTAQGFEFLSHVGRGSCVASLVRDFRPNQNTRTIA